MVADVVVLVPVGTLFAFEGIAAIADLLEVVDHVAERV